MNIFDIRRINEKKAAKPGVSYSAVDSDGILKVWTGQSDGSLKLARGSSITQVIQGSQDPFVESDPIFTSWLNTPPNLSEFNNDVGYLTSFVETDPVWTADKPSYLTSSVAASTYQPLDSDLSTISGLTPSNDDIIQRKAGVWTNRSISELKTDLSLSGTNTGDQTLPTRASLGLDTTDSPQFLALNIGNASDTTLARSGAGDLTVEGNRLYRAGGTDVPIADGGTGASTAASARTNLVTRFTEHFEGASLNPADSASYYFGAHSALQPSTTINLEYRKIPVACVLKEAVINISVGGTLGTSESSTFIVNQNNGTLTTLSSSVTMNAVIQSFVVTGLSVSFSAGDTIEIKWSTPAWATNPTTVRPSVVLYFE